MRPLNPDSTGAQVNNLYMWLHQCSPGQFSEFIALVRSTADEAGEAHEELAVMLEKAYAQFRANGDSKSSRSS